MSISYTLSDKTIRAVDNVSLNLKYGESLGIAGESGCGKSTLASSIIRNISYPGKITNGEIFLDGEDIIKLSENDFTSRIRWTRISMIFQGAMNSLDPVYKIKSQINDLVLTHKNKIDNFEILRLLTSVGLDESVLDKYPHELSGGMKQRVVIVLALLLGPEIIIADEPTTALDVIVQGQIIKLLKELKDKKISIILISHDLALISELVDKIAIMYSGEIVELRKTSRIISNPLHPYTRHLIFVTPQIDDVDRKIPKLNNNTVMPLISDTGYVGCRYISRCEYAMDICKKDPPLIQIRDHNNNDDGFVRCWLYT